MVIFSVIMPTYNRGHIIKNAIMSVINQIFQSWELIIVDDGSTDNTSEVVSSIADNRINYIRYEKNAGSNYARNIGIGKASGKYLAFIDSDNQWRTNYLESQLDIFQNDEVSADVVFARCFITGSWGTFIFPNNLYTDFSSNEKITRYALYSSVFDTNVVCMKRIVWEQSGKFDENLFRFQDWEYFLRILVQGKYQFRFNDAVLCDNYLQQDSITEKKELFWDSRLYIFEKNIEKSREIGEVVNIILYLLKQPDVNYILPYHVEKLMGMLFSNEVTELYKKYYAEYERYCTSYYEISNMINEKSGQAEYALKLADKNEQILQIERKWITFKQNGNNVASVLMEKGIYRIAIYGYGVLGILLLQELKNSGVSVKYIVDKRKIKLGKEAGIPVIINSSGSLKQLKGVDAIVVTAIADYEEIRKELEKKTDVKVIHLGGLLI
ncbi:MAG: glycosyltransferase [Hungatella sp.]|nr:glycosyltransferase [Hungatella sp.]